MAREVPKGSVLRSRLLTVTEGKSVASRCSGGMQMTKRTAESYDIEGTGFVTNTLNLIGNAAIRDADQGFSEQTSLGFYVQEQVGYRNRLFVTGAVRVDEAPFHTLHLAEAARPILKGEAQVWLREVSEGKTGRGSRSRKTSRSSDLAPDGQPLPLAGRECLEALKAWRAEVAKAHNLPAFVIFHDATLRSIAAQLPTSMADLEGISGIGEKKREAYGAEVLRVVSAFV